MTLFIAIISVVNIALGYGLAVYLRTDQTATLSNVLSEDIEQNIEQNDSPQSQPEVPAPDDMLAHPDEIDLEKEAKKESLLNPSVDTTVPEPEEVVQPNAESVVSKDPTPDPEAVAEALLAEATQDKNEPTPAVAEMLAEKEEDDSSQKPENEPAAELSPAEPDDIDIESVAAEADEPISEPTAELTTEPAEEPSAIEQPTVTEQPDIPLDEDALEGLETFRQQLAEQTELSTTSADASEETEPEASSDVEHSESELLAGIEAFRAQLTEAQG